MSQSADRDLYPRRYRHHGTCPAFNSNAVKCRMLQSSLTDRYERGALGDQNVALCAAKPDCHPLPLWMNTWNLCLLYTDICTDVCLFCWRYNPLLLYSHSPTTGFSLRVFEVSWSHTQRRATVGRIPLDEWSIRRRDLYLTTHNTHNRQTSMLPVGFEPTISAGERPYTYALDRAATGTGTYAQIK